MKLLDRARTASPFLDHLVRTYQRYQADTGDRLASSVTYYWFLSLFPILLIAVYVTRKALGDTAGLDITKGLSPYLGQATAQAVGGVVQSNAGTAGLIGLLGTLFTGLGWIGALRDAIRSIWHVRIAGGNLVTRKLIDVLALVGLFAVIASSVFVSTAATAARKSVLSTLDLHGVGASVLTIGLSYLVGFLVDLAIFLYLFLGLAQVPVRARQALRGACFGAVAFEVIKALGALYITRTTTKGEATYGTFAVVVGLLLFLNIVSRILLYTAAFTVTIDGASPRTDDHVRDTPAVERSWAPRTQPEPVVEPVPEPVVDVPPQPAGDSRAEQAVVLAAKAVTAASAAVVVAVALYGGKTVVRMARR